MISFVKAFYSSSARKTSASTTQKNYSAEHNAHLYRQRDEFYLFSIIIWIFSLFDSTFSHTLKRLQRRAGIDSLVILFPRLAYQCWDTGRTIRIFNWTLPCEFFNVVGGFAISAYWYVFYYPPKPIDQISKFADISALMTFALYQALRMNVMR